MGLSRTLARFQRQIIRRLSVKGLATIAEVRTRAPGEFDELVGQIRAAGTDSLEHFKNGYTHEGGLYLQQNPDEFAALILFLRQHRPLAQYLEIGSASGGTCLLLQQHLGFTRVLSVDDGQHVRAVEQTKNFARVPGSVRYLGDSHAEPARAFLEREVQGKLDLAFVDGDHSYEGVAQDIRLTLPFCRSGTLLVLHDTVACAGVEQAWLELVRGGRAEPLAEFIGASEPLGIGVARVV